MEIHSIARLDAHELQIRQLQTEVTEIKSVLTLLEKDRAESVEFRKAFLAWIKHQQKRIDDGSSGTGFAGTSLSSLGSNATIAKPGPSISDPSKSAYEVWPLTSKPLSPLPDLFSAPKPPSPLPDLFSDPKIDHVVDCSSDSFPISPSVLPQLKAIISSHEENSLGHSLMSCSPNLIRSQVKLGSRTVVGHDEEQHKIMGRDSTTLGPLARLGSNTASKSLLDGKNESRDVILILVPPITFPFVDSRLQWNSNSLEGVLTQAAGQIEGFEDFLLTVFLFQQPPQLEKQLLMAPVVSMFKIGDRRLGWKGGTVPFISNPDTACHKPPKLVVLNVDVIIYGVDFPWKPPWYCRLQKCLRNLELITIWFLWELNGQPRPPDAFRVTLIT